jgi:pyridoxamine 5'-phosphate oxidase
MKLNIKDIRREYKKKKLNKINVDPNPFKQFEVWMQEAIAREDDPTAMILTTVSADNQPSSRTVLLKELKDEQLIFYTNYQSRKGTQIENNPKVSVTFFWQKLERQVHFEGIASKVSPEESDEYFQTRPRKSRIGACISPQSKPIRDRNEIKASFVRLATQLIGQKVPRPDHWGGYSIKSNRVEFWQGRSNRLHDRILFQLKDDNSWSIDRLAP